MGKKLDRLMREAIEAAAITEGGLASLAGRHPVSFARYKRGDRPVTPEAAKELADALERHSETLKEHAGRLREQAAIDDARRAHRRT